MLCAEVKLTHVCKVDFACCFRLCDEFEKIAEKALSTPPNTAELMEMKVPLLRRGHVGVAGRIRTGTRAPRRLRQRLPAIRMC